MRIVCPACAAAYEVPDGRLSAGRVVRCARCDTDWVPLAEEARVEPAPAPEPPPEVAAEPEVPIETVAVPEPAILPPAVSAEERRPVEGRPKAGMALRAAWAVSVAVVLASIWYAYSAREAVMHAWPPSVRAYAALGLADRH